eukprot:scaffold19929_cov179-Skeletonema_dohrnii-CCMP3373.AAC.1
MVAQCAAGCRLQAAGASFIGPHQGIARYDVVNELLASVQDGLVRTPRRCRSMADTHIKEHVKWNISFCARSNYNGPLEAVDCHIHSAGYDMLLE